MFFFTIKRYYKVGSQHKTPLCRQNDVIDRKASLKLEKILNIEKERAKKDLHQLSSIYIHRYVAF
jgi:hypothetical protein